MRVILRVGLHLVRYEGVYMLRSRKRNILLGAFIFLGALALGATSSSLHATQGFCPGTNYCYTANNCPNGCRQVACNTESCPDPGTQGTGCYICAPV